MPHYKTAARFPPHLAAGEKNALGSAMRKRTKNRFFRTAEAGARNEE
jgi:hypothetical protein